MIYGVISEKEMSASGSNHDQALNDGIFSFPPGMVSELPLSVWDLFDASDVDTILGTMGPSAHSRQASREQSPAPREQPRPAARPTAGSLVVESSAHMLAGRRGSTTGQEDFPEGSDEEYPESEASEEEDEEVLEVDMEDEEWTESAEQRRRRGRAQPRGAKRSLGGSATGASKPKAPRATGTGGSHGSAIKPKNDSLWRKYGQKNLRNMKGVVRAYYKCHWPDCDAKKMVDHHKGDMSVISVNYDGKHNHDYPSRHG